MTTDSLVCCICGKPSSYSTGSREFCSDCWHTEFNDYDKLIAEWEQLEFISTIATNADNVTKIKQRMNEIEEMLDR
jgi:hypothetical protein